MKFLKSGLMLLSAALMSSGCEQSASDNFGNALALAKAKMNNGSEASEVAMACPEQPDHNAELLHLKQQLQLTQQKLAQSNAELIAARNQLSAHSSESSVKATVQAEQAHVELERRISTSTTQHVKQLEQRLTEQDLQLGELHKTLLQTEEGCRAVANELERKAPS